MKLPIVKTSTPEKEMSVVEKDMMPLREAMNQFFGESLWNPFSLTRWQFPTVSMEGWLPRADISETDTAVQITINVPNVDPNKLRVTVEEDTLTVSGSTEEERKEEGKTYYHVERERGEFSRSFTLPRGIDTGNIEAESKNGTMVITLPKKEKEKASQKQEIDVKVK